LCGRAADNPQALALLAEAPPEQRKANLLLAALHERVLAGAASSRLALRCSGGASASRARACGLSAARPHNAA